LYRIVDICSLWHRVSVTSPE